MRDMKELYQVIKMFTIWNDEEQREMVFEPGTYVEADQDREVIFLFGEEFDVTFDKGWDNYLDVNWDY